LKPNLLLNSDFDHFVFSGFNPIISLIDDNTAFGIWAMARIMKGRINKEIFLSIFVIEDGNSLSKRETIFSWIYIKIGILCFNLR